MRIPWPAVAVMIALAAVLSSRLARWAGARARHRRARADAAAVREETANTCEKVRVRSARSERAFLGSVPADRTAPAADGAVLVLEQDVLLDDDRGRRLRLPRSSHLSLSIVGDGVDVAARASEPWRFDFHLRADREFWLLARRPVSTAVTTDRALDVAPAPALRHFVPVILLSDVENARLFETPEPAAPLLTLRRPMMAASAIAVASGVSVTVAAIGLAGFVLVFGAAELIDWIG